MEKRNVQNCTFLRSSNIHVQLNKVRIVKKKKLAKIHNFKQKSIQ